MAALIASVILFYLGKLTLMFIVRMNVNLAMFINLVRLSEKVASLFLNEVIAGYANTEL